MSIHDGGPAFPDPERFGADGRPFTRDHGYRRDGASLRDLYAGFALAGLLAEASHPKAPGVGESDHQRLARDSYRLADAMLQAREES